MQEEFIAEIKPIRHWPFLKVLGYVFLGLVLADGLFVRVIPMNVFVRLMMVGTLIFGCVIALLNLLKWTWGRKKALYPAIVVAFLAFTWYNLASKPPDKPALRSLYISRVMAHVGQGYREGGEVKGALDDSGLARSTFWQSMLIEGSREVNPYLIGANFWRFWWRDLDTMDILVGKYGYTEVVEAAPRIARHAFKYLQAGDMAVINGRMEVMIYCGNGQWASASKADGKVVLISDRMSTDRPEFNTPVIIVRWWLLGGK